jgi:hypothetical protein
MARRPGGESRFNLTPGQRRLAGWGVALALVIGTAVVVGLLGGNGDGGDVAPGASEGSPAPSIPQIAFGTAIDPVSGEVAAASRTTRFDADDAFAWSVRPTGPLPPLVYVQVERTGGGPEEIVQAIPGEGDQPLAEGAEVIAFSVPALNLLEAFGPGTYAMRVHLEADDEPIAEGTFELIDPVPPASGVPSSSP